MKSRMLIALLLLVLSFAPTWAKEKPEIKCILTLNDGKTVEGWFLKEGYGTYGVQNVKNLDEITIAANKGDKKGTTYKANDVKTLKYVNTETGESKEYHSLYAVKAMTKPENMNPSGHKYFWLVIYEGKYVTGFLSTSGSSFYMGGNGWWNKSSFPFSYCVKGDDIAVTYYNPGLDSKAIVRLSFKRFPKMVEYIDNKDFKMKEIREAPLSPLERLDAILTAEKQ